MVTAGSYVCKIGAPDHDEAKLFPLNPALLPALLSVTFSIRIKNRIRGSCNAMDTFHLISHFEITFHSILKTNKTFWDTLREKHHPQEACVCFQIVIPGQALMGCLQHRHSHNGNALGWSFGNKGSSISSDLDYQSWKQNSSFFACEKSPKNT